MKREAGDYIEDIINAMDKAINFVKNISYEEIPPLKPLFEKILSHL